MTKTKCIIVDDEPLALEVMENHLKKFENIEIAAKCSSALQAFNVINSSPIDLMFLDIQMPQLSGLDFLRSLKNPPKVILTTAFREYAVEGFELEVLDYLLKPVSFERLLTAINKYYQITGEQTKNPANLEAERNSGEEFIYVKVEKKIVKVMLREILYLESMKDYVIIYTEDSKFITKATLTDFENKLPEPEFLRIHRSFIAAVSKIKAVTASSVEVGNKELVIGRSYKDRLMQSLNLTT